MDYLKIKEKTKKLGCIIINMSESVNVSSQTKSTKKSTGGSRGRNSRQMPLYLDEFIAVYARGRCTTPFPWTPGVR